MKDYEAVTLKAFLAALANQSDPLAAEIQTQLNQIGANYEQHITDLDLIASQNPDLSEPYKTARKLLDSPQERNKGLDITPNASGEKQNPESGAIDNTSQLHSSTPLNELLQKLEKTDDKDLSKITKSVLESANSVEAAPWFIFNLPS
jgi:hypothetical protein